MEGPHGVSMLPDHAGTLLEGVFRQAWAGEE